MKLCPRTTSSGFLSSPRKRSALLSVAAAAASSLQVGLLLCSSARPCYTKNKCFQPRRTQHCAICQEKLEVCSKTNSIKKALLASQLTVERSAELDLGCEVSRAAWPLTPLQFYREYISRNKPCLLSGAQSLLYSMLLCNAKSKSIDAALHCRLYRSLASTGRLE